jgi:hypothetical protein
MNRDMIPTYRGLWLLCLVGTACGGPVSAVIEGAPDGGGADGGPVEALPDAGPDAGPDATADAGPDAGPFEVASHPAFPQVTNKGGPILAAPDIVTITFAGYAYQSDVQAFGDWVATSDWLATVGADYGVGKGVHLKKVVLTELAPSAVTSDEIETLLGSKITDGTLPDPATDRNLLYVIYYPPTTSITLLQNGQAAGVSCQDFGGFHYEGRPTGVRFPYAVLPACDNSSSGLTTLQSIEVGASHEIIEAATDPYPATAPGFQFTDYSSAWVILGGEVGDLCFTDDIAEGNFLAQRVWSNSAAAKGTSPCIPFAADVPYFNSAVSPDGFQAVAAGSSAVFQISGFSTAPTAPWMLSAFPFRGNFRPDITLSQSELSNGQTATLTVAVPLGTPANSFIEILVTSGNQTQGSLWPVAVYVP